MTHKVLFARPVVDEIKRSLKSKNTRLKKRGVIPRMSVVLVGNNPASLSYIRNKKKMCEEIGAEFQLVQLSTSISSNQFLLEVQKLNNDPTIHGIIIQLPVPSHLKKLDIPNLIHPEKDIDGFHSINTQKLYSGSTNLDELLPCTPKGIINLLKYYKIKIERRNIVVIGRSLIVGKPLSMLLTNLNATVTLAHSKTKNLKDITQNADIIISAIGRAKFIKSNHINSRKKPVIIDVGMNSLRGKLVGDVDFEKVKSKTKAISPVPGGVGPMTVISLIENLITATENQIKRKL